MMSWRIEHIGLVVVATLLATLVAGVAQPVLRPRDGVVLTGEKGRKLARQCSRGSPGVVSSDWTPTPQQIVDLEARLPGQILPELRKRVSWREPGKPLRFFRQYAGFVLGSRKIIYINGFPGGDWTTPDPLVKPGAIRLPDWRKTAVIVCDGGPVYFGAEFDPVSHRFTGLAFNGIA
jgi:hypothetical protein